MSPHSGVVFDVMFHPTRIFDDFRRDRLMCMVDGAPPMFLTLSGACEEQPSDNIKELELETRVREKVTQSITIENPTTSPCCIIPESVARSLSQRDRNSRVDAFDQMVNHAADISCFDVVDQRYSSS